MAGGGLHVIGNAALVVAAVAVFEIAQHVERAVELVDPLVVAARPHRDGFGPAIRVELDGNNVANRGVRRDIQLEQDRRGRPGLPG